MGVFDLSSRRTTCNAIIGKRTWQGTCRQHVRRGAKFRSPGSKFAVSLVPLSPVGIAGVLVVLTAVLSATSKVTPKPLNP